MNKYRFLIPLLFSIWPVLGFVIAMLFEPLVGAEIATSFVFMAFPWALLAGIIMSILASAKYRVEGKYKQLAFWGMVQKVSYIPLVYLLLEIPNIKFGENSLENEEYGMIGLFVVAMMGMVVLMLFAIALGGLCISLAVSATYTIKAINVLYRNGRITKVLRVLMIIGSLIIPIDIPIAIIVWILLRKCNGLDTWGVKRDDEEYA